MHVYIGDGDSGIPVIGALSTNYGIGGETDRGRVGTCETMWDGACTRVVRSMSTLSTAVSIDQEVAHSYIEFSSTYQRGNHHFSRCVVDSTGAYLWDIS